MTKFIGDGDGDDPSNDNVVDIKRHITRSNASEMGAKGGKSRSDYIRLLASLGLKKLAFDPDFKKYHSAGEDFAQAHLSRLAKLADGNVGPGPASIITNAAIQLAASRYFYDKGGVGNPEEGGVDNAMLMRASKLANDANKSVLMAYQAIKEEATLLALTGKAREAIEMPVPPWMETIDPSGDDDK